MGKEVKKKVQVDVHGVLVKCPKFKFGGFIAIEECKPCKHHVDIKEAGGGENGIPLQLDILCGMPTRIRAIYHYGGIDDGTSL